MMEFKRKSFLFLFFSFFAFGEEVSNHHGEGVNFSKSSFQKAGENPSPLKPHHIVTKNKTLFRRLNKYFKKKSISEKEIRKFLIKNSYYQSEIVRTKSAYIIKNPVEIIFILKGNSFFTEKEIRRLIKFDENKAGTPFYDFVETTIKKAYQRQGFLNVKIERNTVRKKWKKWLYLNISEGPRVRIAEIKVRGLLSQPDSQYEKFIKNNSTELIRKGFYSKKDLEIGYENLMDHLRSQGYLQSKIYSDRIFFKEDKAFITINLEEGPLTLIQDIKIQNTQALSVWEILSHIKSRAQSPLKIDLLKEDLDSVEKLYKSRGYLHVKITNKDDVIRYIPGERYASVVIQIDEGPKAFISRIAVQGLKQVKEKMVRDLLKFKPGDILTPLKKEQSLQSLGATGLFTDINLEERLVDNEFEVLVLVRERKSRFLRGGFGINSQRGVTTRAYSEIAHRNLFGWGRALIARGSGQVTFGHQEPFVGYELSGRYKEVFIPGYGYEGNISLSESKNIFNYSKNNINFVKKTQISFFVNKDINRNLKIRWNILSFENRREDCTQEECPENPQRIGSSRLNLVLDKRDNIFDPSKGNLSSFMTELALPFLGSSSDISFVKADFQNQFYYTFMEQYTLGFTVKGGIIRTIWDSKYIPVSRAFILGGQTSIRGYDGYVEGERIPGKKYVPIKGANEALTLKKNLRENALTKDAETENALSSSYGLVNVEFRFPVFEDFKGVLFYDLGAVHLTSKTQTVFDYGHSIGVGFRYQTFLIPVGLDVAYKLPPREGNEYRLHFSIGW